MLCTLRFAPERIQAVPPALKRLVDFHRERDVRAETETFVHGRPEPLDHYIRIGDRLEAELAAGLTSNVAAIDARPQSTTGFRAPLSPLRANRTTSAPMSAKIMAQWGLGPMPANSSTRSRTNGPD